MHPRSRILTFALFATGLVLAAPAARALPPGYSQELIHDFVDFPGALRFAPDGRLFYLELFNGRVMTYPTGTSPNSTVWATIPVSYKYERGLLGMAFHPDFPDSPFVYFYHTTVDSPRVNRVVRMTDSAGVGTHYTVLLDSLPAEGLRHHGGRLAFGPDRKLYVTTGEQGNHPEWSRDPSKPMGKILRLDLVGRPAPGNPYGAGNPAYAMGSRNSFGLCFDPVGGQGYFTENGPECDDELNHLVYAGDYGWGYDDPCGGQPAGTKTAMWSVTPPVAPTGCCVYRSNAYPGMNGNLFFGAFNDGAIRRVVINPVNGDVADTVETFSVTQDESVLDVTQGPDGRLWFTTFTRIYRIVQPIVDTAVPDAPGAGNWSAWPNPFVHAVAFAGPPGVAVRAFEIVDLAGRSVRRWRDASAGTRSWDGRDDAGREVPAGIYFIRARTSAGSRVLRVVRLAQP